MAYNDNNTTVNSIGDLNALVRVIEQGAVRATNRVVEFDKGDGSGSKIRGVMLGQNEGVQVLSFPPELNTAPTCPDRIRARVELEDVDSFLKYVKEHALAETRVFCIDGKEGVRFEAEIDFHAKGKPSFCTHRAGLTLKHTQEWNRWMGISGELFGQAAFVEFIAENTVDIFSPNGAEVLEMCRDIEAHQDVQFVGKTTERNGNVKFHYEENTTARTNGFLDIPSELTLSMSVYEGMAKQKIEAAFRFQLKKPSLQIGIIVRGKDRIRREAQKLCQALIETDLNIPVFKGNIAR